MMQVKNPRGKKQTIAVIGMPRSGTTIVTSFLNSIDGAMIVGEPFRGAMVERPAGKDWPNIYDSRHGTLTISPSRDVFEQIEEFAEEHFIRIYGFKETWTPWIDPIKLVEKYAHKIDTVLVTIREPRRNYASMLEHTPQGYSPTGLIEFREEYERLIWHAMINQWFTPIFMFNFIVDPKATIRDAIGWDISGDVELKQYVGSGDTAARWAKEIVPYDKRLPYAGYMESEEEFYNMAKKKIFGL